jgi:hypothetical protein
MEINKKLTVCVFTHIINANTIPYLENQMLVKTIQSTSNVLNLKNVKYKIYIDAAMKRLYPKFYETYTNNINNSIEKNLSDLDVSISEQSAETLRGNWECAINSIDTPYMMFLEHDWEFIRDIDIEKTIETLDNHNEISYLKFSRYPLDGRSYPSPTLWEMYFQKEESLSKSLIPLTRISFWSGNPHIMRVSAVKSFYIPLLNQNKNSLKVHGKSFLEKDIKPLTEQFIRDYGVEKAHSMFGTYMYGNVPYPPVIKHTGDWCRKK